MHRAVTKMARDDVTVMRAASNMAAKHIIIVLPYGTDIIRRLQEIVSF